MRKGSKMSLESRLKMRLAKLGRKMPWVSKRMKGGVPWNKGKPYPQVTGEKNGDWRGENVGYHGIHKWVKRWKGSPDTCEHCGKSGLKGKQIHWANVDHKYRRVLDDYIRLCASCHKLYDIEKFGFYK